MQVVIPVIEKLVPEAKIPVNHYWLLVINIRDRRFELLDSMRSKADKRLDSCARKLIAIIRVLWDEHYKDSKVNLDNFGYVDIEPPKQIRRKFLYYVIRCSFMSIFSESRFLT